MLDEKVISSLNKYVQFPEEDLQFFLSNAEQLIIKKNHHLIQEGEDPAHFTLIRQGCLMTYFKGNDGHQHVIQFGTDMWWTGDLQAITSGGPSFYSIKAIVETEVYTVSKELYDELLNRSAAFERYFRIIFQNALVSHQRRIIRNISYSAEDKYQEFLERYPKLELVVPQKYIASYIGITPEFLSKLRRKIAGKE